MYVCIHTLHYVIPHVCIMYMCSTESLVMITPHLLIPKPCNFNILILLL